MELVQRGKKKATLGLALIAKNEEAEIRGCMESCAGVDQISVVDTGSKDKTVEIAREMGAIVSENEFNWPDLPSVEGIDFAAARNRSFDLLSTDWIIFLDCDERVDKGGINTAKFYIDMVPDNIDVVMCHMYDDQGGIFEREKLIRNIPEMRFTGRIHECPMKKYGAFKSPKPVRIHYTPRPNCERNHLILREELARLPDDPRLQYLALREYLAMNDNPSAIYWGERFRRTVRKSGIPKISHYPDALHSLAWAYVRMAGAGESTEYTRAKELLLECLGINADMREASEMLAALCEHEGNNVNKQRWIDFAASAQNSNTLFIKKNRIF